MPLTRDELLGEVSANYSKADLTVPLSISTSRILYILTPTTNISQTSTRTAFWISRFYNSFSHSSYFAVL